MSIEAKRILWPTDFSALSIKGAHYALHFAEAFGAELHVLHVCQPLIGSSADLPLTPGMLLGVTQSEVLAAANARLKELASQEFGALKNVRHEVRIGVPWQEICRFAEAERIDLIVICTHGYTGLRHVLIGSIAERVVQHAPCPVLTVKATERDFIRDRADGQPTGDGGKV